MKTETIYARVTPELARKVQAAAKDAGESDAFILREALREYFAARAVNSANVAALSESSISAAAPGPGSPATGALPPVSYQSKSSIPRRSKSRPTPDASKKAP